jgi:hypothetical protein
MTDIKTEIKGNDLLLSVNRPRRRAMFFEKVGGGKEVPFGKTLVLYKLKNGEDYFSTGKLKSKIQTENGYEYLFREDSASDGLPDAATSFDYWLLPTLP